MTRPERARLTSVWFPSHYRMISSEEVPASEVVDPLLDVPWSGLIPDDQWEVFVAAVNALDDVGIPFLVHGAMAMAAYTGRWRNTKDMDVIVHPVNRQAAIDAVIGAGFEDYFATEAYDRSWIFRSCRNGVVVDIIWGLPNHRVAIDDGWFRRAEPVRVRGRILGAVPAEELVRVKLYVMQRERCDWVDVLNVLAAAVERVDWHWLVERMDEDRPLLHAGLVLFNWLCPGRAQALPGWVREQFALQTFAFEQPDDVEKQHVDLLDSRPWFALHQSGDEPLQR